MYVSGLRTERSTTKELVNGQVCVHVGSLQLGKRRVEGTSAGSSVRAVVVRAVVVRVVVLKGSNSVGSSRGGSSSVGSSSEGGSSPGRAWESHSSTCSLDP